MWERPWTDQDAFIIGGGSSLKDFDFQLLRGRNTIGCNDAYRLGEDICHICMFGDATWFHKIRADLMQNFKGPICHVAPSLSKLKMPGVVSLRRMSVGLWDGEQIGWNFSTGASAINLAINLGATRIFLLGVDLALQKGQSHWHPHRAHPTKPEIFARFRKGFEHIGNALKLPKYSGVQVFHVTDQASALPWFMTMPFREFFVVLEKTPAQIKPVWLSSTQ